MWLTDSASKMHVSFIGIVLCEQARYLNFSQQQGNPSLEQYVSTDFHGVVVDSWALNRFLF